MTMKITGLRGGVLALLLGLALLGGMLVSPAAARRREPAKVEKGIPEEDRPWAGIPWVVGIVLGGGAVAVSLKNAKRTHLD